jgi:hypothetical protein
MKLDQLPFDVLHNVAEHLRGDYDKNKKFPTYEELEQEPGGVDEDLDEAQPALDHLDYLKNAKGSLGAFEQVSKEFRNVVRTSAMGALNNHIDREGRAAKAKVAFEAALFTKPDERSVKITAAFGCSKDLSTEDKTDLVELYDRMEPGHIKDPLIKAIEENFDNFDLDQKRKLLFRTYRNVSVLEDKKEWNIRRNESYPNEKNLIPDEKHWDSLASLYVMTPRFGNESANHRIVSNALLASRERKTNFSQAADRLAAEMLQWGKEFPGLDFPIQSRDKPRPQVRALQGQEEDTGRVAELTRQVEKLPGRLSDTHHEDHTSAKVPTSHVELDQTPNEIPNQAAAKPDPRADVRNRPERRRGNSGRSD